MITTRYGFRRCRLRRKPSRFTFVCLRCGQAGIVSVNADLVRIDAHHKEALAGHLTESSLDAKRKQKNRHLRIEFMQHSLDLVAGFRHDIAFLSPKFVKRYSAFRERSLDLL
jgi:hypothetical protein